MFRWARAVVAKIMAPIKRATRVVQRQVGSLWNVVKGILALILAGLAVSVSHTLALGLVVVPFVKRVKNDYAKVFVGFIVATLGAILVTNGLVVFADAFTIVLAWGMYEMLTQWWARVEEAEKARVA
jgi:hypothetical protein